MSKRPSTKFAITLAFRSENGEVTERAQFSLAETHKLAGVPVSTLRKLCRSGVLNPITGFGRKWYISAADLLQIFNQRLHKPKQRSPDPAQMPEAKETIVGKDERSNLC